MKQEIPGEVIGENEWPRHRAAAWLAVVILAVTAILVGACVPTGQLGARPAASPMESVEAYLQRYQPGPTPRLFQTTQLLDRRGRLIAERWEEGRRTWVPLSRISRHLVDATIATEDASFYYNTGVDPARIAGAALQNAQTGQVVSGASTITMQLARNLFLGPEERYDQTVDRKVLEAGLAQELTSLFTKEEVLEMYLNLLNYGSLAYGPEAAAQLYFGKPASDLSLAEATLLAGIPQQPAEFDLFKSLPAARARQRVVLDLMVRHGYLSPGAAAAAYAEAVPLRSDRELGVNRAPHFVQYVEDTLEARLGIDDLRRSGLVITTTLDLDLQALASDIVKARVAELQPRYDLSNAALVALRPGSNEVMVMVGSADFADAAIDGQVNVALSPRQPGSAIKPVLYATAFEDSLISPATVLWDVPVTYTVSADNIYTPRNYDERFHGPVTARTALANSYNIPAIKLLDGVSVERMLESAQAMGLRSLTQGETYYGLSLTLGGGEVTLLDLTTAFATLANQGTFVEPTPVLNMRDALGQAVPGWQPEAPRQVVSPAAAFLVTDILADNIARTPAFGANSPLRLSRPAAAKTGTTSDWRDNWTLGYTRHLVAGVWAGNSDGRPMQNTTGLTGAAPIWHEFMEGVLAEPHLLAVLDAPEDAAAWEFLPPPDLEQRPECPPGVSCREGGEYFSPQWLQAAGEGGPLADSVAQVPSAPLYVDSGQGAQWAAYCQVEPAVARPLLKLPGRFGLPDPGQPPAALDPEAERERLHAVAWSLKHSTPVDLGPCDRLGDTVARAAALVPEAAGVQVLIDLSAAMDPTAGPVAGDTAIPVASTWTGLSGPVRYGLSQPVAHHDGCQGNYIIGTVFDGAGGAVAGVRIALVDQYGNQAMAVSKDGTNDYGYYDFPIGDAPNRYTLTVVDEAGTPLSAPVVVNHLQGDAGSVPCHTVIWRGG